jgi:hypothetical protein
MNERIKELAHEVFSFKYKTSPYELNPSHRMDHLHKFAELIVWECAKQVEDFYKEDRFNCLSADEKIKEYFGIEE